jgi:hypothetical protein
MGSKANMIRFAVVGLLLAVMLPVASALAQADRDTLLPDLAPRELEILGNLEITFPSLRRQPLSGFNPPPRIYEVPRGWRPWTEDYKQASADLPGSSLIQPASPPPTISVGQHPHRGELSLGIGRYLSREVHAQAAFDVGSNVVVYGDAFHDGLDKFKPFDDTLGTEAPRQNYDGLAGLSYRAGATTAGLEFSGFYRDLDLYGARGDTMPFASPQRTGQGLGGRVWVATGSASSLPVHLSAAYRTNTFETTRTGIPTNASIDGSQVTVAGDAKLKRGPRALLLDGKLWINSQSGSGDLQQMPDLTLDVATFQGGGEFRINMGDRGMLRFGAEVHGYTLSQDASAAPPPSGSSKLYVAPRISYLSSIGSGAEFYVKNTPIVNFRDQEGMFEANPFLIDGAMSLPELSIVNVESGVVLYNGPFRVAARAGITTYENFMYYVSSSSPIFGNGFFDVRYADADILFAGGDIGVTLPGRFSATLTGRWQSAKLDNDQDVPNYPGFEGGMRASYAFAGDRALLQLDGKFVGSRNVDYTGGAVLSGYVDTAFLASYYFENGIGFFGRVQTMTANTFERWVGYPVADWVTLGGVRLRW